MLKILKFLATYYVLVIATLVVIVAFVTATTYNQLSIAIVVYLLFVYFVFTVFPRKIRKLPAEQPVTAPIQPPVMKQAEAEKVVEVVKKENVEIADIDKRAFLKLIGGVGLSLLLVSIFSKKVDAILFKSPADATQSKPQPTDGYKISETDTENNTVTFHGFLNQDGAWYIMRADTDQGSFRYVKGESNFHDNWNNRENLKYDYFSNAFR